MTKDRATLAVATHRDRKRVSTIAPIFKAIGTTNTKSTKPREPTTRAAIPALILVINKVRGILALSETNLKISNGRDSTNSSEELTTRAGDPNLILVINKMLGVLAISETELKTSNGLN